LQIRLNVLMTGFSILRGDACLPVNVR
jgi:hypothetical protein